MGVKLNGKGNSHAKGLIANGGVDKTSSWSFSTEDGNALLGNPPDWGAYGKWFLGVDSSAKDDTKEHYKYPFGKNGKVYRSGLVAIRQRAGQQNANDIFNAAGNLIDSIDNTEKALRMLIGKKQERIFTFEKSTVDEENRTVELSFSSDEPGERWYGFEILDHQPSSVRLKRMNDGGAVLFNHKTDNHIGTVEPATAHIDTDSRKGRAMVRFGKGVQASEKFQDVKDEILRNVSVGYWVHQMVMEKEVDGVKTYRVTDWEPLEISFVPVPMDASVGVGRTAENGGEPVKETPVNEPEKVVKTTEVKKMDKCIKCGTLLVEGVCPTCKALEARQKENVEILAIGKRLGKEAEAATAITEGKSAAEFKDVIVAGMKPPAEVTTVKVGEDNATKAGFPTFGHFLQAVVKAEQRGGTTDPRLVFERTAPSGSSEGVPSDGGFLLQNNFTTELLNLAHDTGVLYSRCRRIPIGAGANGIDAPVIIESSRATGSRFGGLQMYWDPEGQEATSKKPKFGRLAMKLNKLHGLWYVTDEMLQDATQLQAIGTAAFAEETGFMVDDGIFRGTGAGEMLGFLNAPCLVSISGETGQTTDTIVSDNILKMYQAMPARNKANAVWLYNSECYAQLATLYVNAGVSGVVSFLPPGGLSASPYAQLQGRPMIEIEHASALGDAGCLSFVDLNEYLVIEKGAMEAVSSIHVRFIYDEMTFKFTVRLNGQPIWKSAVAPYKGSVSKSPFVTLAAI